MVPTGHITRKAKLRDAARDQSMFLTAAKPSRKQLERASPSRSRPPAAWRQAWGDAHPGAAVSHPVFSTGCSMWPEMKEEEESNTEPSGQSLPRGGSY